MLILYEVIFDQEDMKLQYEICQDVLQILNADIKCLNVGRSFHNTTQKNTFFHQDGTCANLVRTPILN